MIKVNIRRFDRAVSYLGVHLMLLLRFSKAFVIFSFERAIRLSKSVPELISPLEGMSATLCSDFISAKAMFFA